MEILVTTEHQADRDRAAPALGAPALDAPALGESERPTVRVYWRPGCLFCARLRRGLRVAGMKATEINIWESPSAAAIVRQVTGGDETVPTVIVGDRALVNPSVAAVFAAAGLAPGPEAPRQSWLAQTCRRPGALLLIAVLAVSVPLEAVGDHGWSLAFGAMGVALSGMARMGIGHRRRDGPSRSEARANKEEQ